MNTFSLETTDVELEILSPAYLDYNSVSKCVPDSQTKTFYHTAVSSTEEVLKTSM